MRAITVDDERPMLSALTSAVSASPDISDVWEFSSCTKVLEWAQSNPVDIAFLDIHMRGMGGLSLAEKLCALQPDCKIIFCTGYTEYALDAIQMHCAAYLVKPITKEAVQKEIDYIKGKKNKEKLLTVRCFGNFEATSKGVLLPFKRSKTMELLAFLIDRKGACVTAKQICAALWEDGTDDRKNQKYLYQLFYDLRATLEAIGASDVLKKSSVQYALDTDRIECDYYNYLATNTPKFFGEYMTQYSWAEETCALLTKNQ